MNLQRSTEAVGSVASRLDTSFVKGKAIVVNNPVQGRRNDVVTAEVYFENEPVFLAVFDDKGKEVPSQILNKQGDKYTVAFAADVPSVGYRVYDVRESSKACGISTGLYVNERRLENGKFIVMLNANGDVSSIFDKELNKHIISEPVEMRIFKYTGSGVYPAWEIPYADIKVKHTAVPQLVSIKIKDCGAARVAIETVKTYEKSVFKQVVSLTAGGKSVDFFNEIDWRSTRKLLKTNFSFTAENKRANYDLGFGYISRKNNTKRLYEVPAQMWADITDIGKGYGVSVFSDSRYGWDKPADNTLRLTGIHTPRAEFLSGSKQNALDLGLNRYSFAIYSHKGEELSGTQLNAAYFNQPLNAFETDVHKGVLGTEYSFAEISGGAVIRCIKKAQESDSIVVRVNEIAGKEQQGVELKLADGIRAAKEAYASEEIIGTVKVNAGKIAFDLKPFEAKTFVLTLRKAKNQAETFAQSNVDLGFNARVTLKNSQRISGYLPDNEAIPAELYPETAMCGGVSFKLGDVDAENALIPAGNEVKLPKGATQLHFVAASFDGDKPYTVKVNGRDYTFIVSDAHEAVGAWDMYALSETGYIKKDVLAWNATHTHSDKGDMYGKNLYFFKYTLDLPENAESVYFTADKNIVILSATASEGKSFCRTATELYDSPKRENALHVFSNFEKFLGSHKYLWGALDVMKYGDPLTRSKDFESDI